MAKTISKIHQRVMQARSARKSDINKAFNTIVSNGMEIDRSDDADFLAHNTQTWDDLNGLRQELAEATMTFTGQVYAMANDPVVIQNLGTKKEQFSKLVQTYFADAQAFSQRVASLRVQHEHLTGAINTLEEYGQMQRLALEYQNAGSELHTLLAPTISELVLIVHECNSAALAQAQADLANPSVISDVQIKA